MKARGTLHACPGGCQTLKAPRFIRPSRRRCVPIVAAVKEIFMPALSSTMTEGKIVSWLKNPGDKVSKGESVVVVESDKADMDVESFDNGILGAIVINEGGVANVGSPIAYIAESEADLEAAQAKAGGGSAAAAPSPAKEEPKADAQVAQPEPEAVASVSQSKSGSIASTTAAPPAPPPPPPPAAPQPQKRTDGRIIATPYAKKLAKDMGVDLNSLIGSGPAGRITAQDVESFKSNGGSAAPAAPPSAPSSAAVASNGASAPPKPEAVSAPVAPKPQPSGGTSVSELKGTTIPFNAMQQAVAKNMVESLKVPEFRVTYTVTTDKLDTLYKRLKPKGVTMTALLAKAAGVALSKHPLLYSACTKGGDGITYGERVNVALAVAMPGGGLITPVIKDADSTDIYQISRNWADLVKRARSKQLNPDEYNSGNFTISNLGMYGADIFDAILPPGTAAILAVAASKPTVVADNQGRFFVTKQMKLNLTADHRIIYGAEAAEFMQTLKAVIEDPDQLTF